jgi:hypothetical protein
VFQIVNYLEGAIPFTVYFVGCVRVFLQDSPMFNYFGDKFATIVTENITFWRALCFAVDGIDVIQKKCGKFHTKNSFELESNQGVISWRF